jgi:hypothetical protein
MLLVDTNVLVDVLEDDPNGRIGRSANCARSRKSTGWRSTQSSMPSYH